MMPYDLLIILLLSFVVSAISMPLIIKFSDKNGFHDYIDERKVHSGKISRLGGLGIFLGFGSAFIYLLIFDFAVQFNVVLFIIAMLVAFLTGFLDDLFHIRAWHKLILQLLCGLVVAYAGLRIQKITILEDVTIYFGIFSYVATMLWVSGFMNAINMLDGLDGLASGIVMIASISLGVIGWLEGALVVTYLAIALIGAIVGFLIFNFPPAKIFMGDGGAYFLGFIYAVVPLIGIKKTASIIIFLIPLVLLLVPLLDMVTVMKKRFSGGYHVFLADRSHIHHRLLHIGFTNRGILLVLYLYSIVLGAFAILMIHLRPFHSFILMVLLICLTLLAFYTISVAEQEIERLEKNSEKNSSPEK